ncbi:MAG: plastocyanin/azurin family copper-binding protein [Vicinamibacterales bacterium]
MTKVVRRHWRTAAVCAAVFIGIVAVLPLVAERAPARQIVLMTRGMTFVLEGQPEMNPIVRVTAGERVRIVVRNETPGMVHDFAIPSWDVATRSLSNGQQGSVTFEAPTAPGTYEYQCRPHSEMMRGVIEVVAR